MEILKAYKFQLKPNEADGRHLSRFAGSCRFVWNKALALQKERLDAKEKRFTYNDLACHLVEWKRDRTTAFLAEANAQALQQTLKNLDRAFRDAFNKKSPKRFPRFKKKGVHDGFRYPQGFKVDEANSRIFLPKIGWVLYRKSRPIEGTPKNVTVARQGDRWFVSIQTEREIAKPVHPSTSTVGIDLGVANFATLSDGTVFPPLNSFKKREQRLAFLQRRMSRKLKFSANWKKAKKRVTRCHEEIGNIRRDFLHKTSTAISKNHAVVVIEDLKVANMSKSAKGTKSAPGRNVRAKAGLNRAILDQGWGEFRRQLEYKQAWRGGMVVAVDPKNTSRECNQCGHTARENRQSQAGFLCVRCGHTQHADLNAARNILAAGHAVFACGESAQSGRSTKQEPTERASACIAA